MSKNGKLLSDLEKSFCLKISSGDSLHAKRALALLSLNDGNTQKETTNISGLTLGQVKYLSRTFKESGLAIFPEALPETKSPEEENQRKNKTKKKKKKKEKKMGKKKDKDKKNKKDKKKKGKKKKNKKIKSRRKNNR